MIGVDARILSRHLTEVGRYTLKMYRALFKMENILLYLYRQSAIYVKCSLGLDTTYIQTGNWNNVLRRQLIRGLFTIVGVKIVYMPSAEQFWRNAVV